MFRTQVNGDGDDLNWFSKVNMDIEEKEFDVAPNERNNQKIKSENTSVKGENDGDSEQDGKKRTQDDYHRVKTWESAHLHTVHSKEQQKEERKEEKKKNNTSSLLIIPIPNPLVPTNHIEKPIMQQDQIKFLRKRKPDIKQKPNGKARKKSEVSNSDSDEEHSDLREGGTKEKNKLLQLMMSLFEGKNISAESISELSKEERFSFCSLVLRKFGIKANHMSGSEAIASIVNEKRDHSKPKRLEENYKLVFKKALKFLLRKFKKDNVIKGKKSELEHKFYRFYFEEIFKKDDIEEEMTIKIDSKGIFSGNALFNPKTINSRYVLNIMKSEVFYNHFVEFLDNFFVMDYNKTREFKIEKVVQKCEESFQKKKGNFGYDEVRKYVEQNPKCKLPWSDKELKSAQESVRQLLCNKLKRSELTDESYSINPPKSDLQPNLSIH